MKYKTFRFLVVSGVVVVGIAGYALLGSSTEPAPGPAEQPAAEPVSPPAQVAPPPAPQQPAVADYRGFLLARLGQPASSDKLKDAFPGPAKVNVYAKNGVWDRAKVDLDRDDKWDEKWWVKDGKIMREVSADDSDHYGKGTVEGTVASPGK
jgi:hypothetical protein